MTPTDIPVIAIIGTTGIGKTKLSLAIAKSLQGEVISVDSCQVYRDAPIISGAVTDKEADGVKHHLLNYCGPKEIIEPDHFADQVLDCILDIHIRGKLPVICGGSISLTNPLLEHPFILRQNLLVVCLEADADVTSALTGTRIDSMIEEGLMDEIKHLYELERAHGVDMSRQPTGVWKSIGYPEFRPCCTELDDENSIESLIERGLEAMKANTRKYAAIQRENLHNTVLPTLKKHKITTITKKVKSKATFRSEIQGPVLTRCQTWLEDQTSFEPGNAMVEGSIRAMSYLASNRLAFAISSSGGKQPCCQMGQNVSKMTLNISGRQGWTKTLEQ